VCLFGVNHRIYVHKIQIIMNTTLATASTLAVQCVLDEAQSYQIQLATQCDGKINGRQACNRPIAAAGSLASEMHDLKGRIDTDQNNLDALQAALSGKDRLAGIRHFVYSVEVDILKRSRTVAWIMCLLLIALFAVLTVHHFTQPIPASCV
jgi:hypothetical protein